MDARAFLLFFMSRKRAEKTVTDFLMQGEWSPAEVSLLLDTPLAIVERWCRVGLLHGARLKGEAWVIPGRALFLFCGRKVEPHYSPETVAGLLDKSVATVRDWIKQGRMAKVKLGVDAQASVLVAESELRRWISA
jgi:hypothetical protein